jgi:hypothetical protein
MKKMNFLKGHTKKRTLYLLIVVLAIASISFRCVGNYRLEQTSLLFIGIPTLITLLIVRYSKRPKSAYGIVFLTITMFLLISGIFLGEGLVCILFMAPIFYGVGAIVVWCFEMLKKRKSNTYAFAIIPLFLLLFQPLDYIKGDTVHSITTVQFVKNASLQQLNARPNFQAHLPLFFKIGFPKPLDIKGEGLAIGAQRTIAFKSSTKGIGTLVLVVKEKTEDAVYFTVKSDDTHIAHWLTFKDIKVELREKEGQTEVLWTTNFTCDLGPSWYFETFQTYAVDLMNAHLIQSYFTEN